MSRYTDPKCKLCRREGRKLYLKGKRCYGAKCPIEKKGAMPPGEPAKRKRPRVTDYGVRLREKQRLKRTYGVTERQFRRYFRDAERSRTDFGLALMTILETRLDNVVRRLGFCWSISQARQLVNHGNILVDGKKVDIPSYNVEVGQKISITEAGLNAVNVLEAQQKYPAEDVPSWLSKEKEFGKIVRLPKKEDLKDEFDISLVVEFYSR